MNKLKTKENDLCVSKMKIVTADLKKLSDLVDSQVVKNTKFNTLKTKVNKRNKKIPDATTLIDINQYNSDKQVWRKKLMLIKKYFALVV